MDFSSGKTLLVLPISKYITELPLGAFAKNNAVARAFVMEKWAISYSIAVKAEVNTTYRVVLCRSLKTYSAIKHALDEHAKPLLALTATDDMSKDPYISKVLQRGDILELRGNVTAKELAQGSLFVIASDSNGEETIQGEVVIEIMEGSTSLMEVPTRQSGDAKKGRGGRPKRSRD